MAELYPRRFGKYVLLKPLARGGMGEIYAAATGERGFEKFCVIKKVIAEKTDRGKANRFLDEAKVVLRLSHANLVPTFDAGEIDGEFYIAMELVEGKDLREIWNRCVRTRTRIPLDVALHVAREIARALAYVHSYGDLRLVHRDVAPPNILLSFFGEVKLTDFGLARSVLKQEHTAPGVVFGRASYLAPEQARGEVADASTDVYSLGIVLWELLTGHQYLQIASLDAATAMSLVRHPRPVAPSAKAPWITPDLDAVVMRALTPVREHRFQTAEEMRQALSEVIVRTSPRADAERAADFLRGLYGTSIREEREERERLLAKSETLDARPSRVAPPAEPAREERADAEEPTPPRRSAVPTIAPRIRSASASSASSASAPASAPTSPSTSFPGGHPLAVDFTGRVIDSRYRIIRKIGEGGMGTVYAGEHVEIGKGVAVKILHPAYSRQQDLVERFRREARAASRVGHPNIIDVTDFGTTEDGCAYFVMEHLDGIDLADVLSHERRIEPARACQITVQICHALQAAHVTGVIHRDLKPENIFLVARDGKADFVKVLDFGIASSLTRASRRLTNPGITVGTPEYMAPEQASGGIVDRRSDIYSVGALLYEMVTGAPPHAGAADVMQSRVNDPPRAPAEMQRDLPPELDRIIMRALAPNPEQRYQTMAQLEYDLTKSLWGRPRAVSDLLGLRDPNRSEDSGGVRDRRDGPSPPAGFDGAREASFSGSFAVAEGPRVSTRGIPVPVGPLAAAAGSPAERANLLSSTSSGRSLSPAPRSPSRPSTPAAGNAGPVLAMASGPIEAAEPAPLDARRFLTTFAFLVLLAGIAAVVYRVLPWARGRSAVTTVAAPAAAPPPARPATATPTLSPAADEERAMRGAAFADGVERRLRLAAVSSLSAEDVTWLEAQLRLLRGEGGAAAAQRFAARGAQLLEAAARAELDAGDANAGIAHYKIAIAMDPGGQGAGRLAQVSRAHARAALAANHPADAVRWARENVALTDADPDAHALLGDALLRLGKNAAALDEFDRALQTRPDDPIWRRGWLRARRRMRGGGRAASPSSSSSPGAHGDETAPSATPEPAPEQQE